MNSFPPIDPVMLEGIHLTFLKMSEYVTALLALVMTIRISMLVFQVSPPESYVEILKDAVVFLMTLALLPFALRLGAEIVGDIAGKLSFETVDVESPYLEKLRDLAKESNFLIRWIGDIGRLSFLYVVKSIFSLLLGLVVSAVPLIMIIEFTFGIRIGISKIGSVLTALLMWPVLWNLLGLLAHNMQPSLASTSFSGSVFFVVVNVFQILSPLFCYSMLKTASPGSAIGAAAMTATGLVAASGKMQRLQSAGNQKRRFGNRPIPKNRRVIK